VRRRLERLGLAVTVYQVAMAVREHWRSIPAAERRRAVALATRLRGRPSRLTGAEQAELRRVLSALRLPVLGQRLAGIGLAKRRRGPR
jgi:hypothetical protein